MHAHALNVVALKLFECLQQELEIICDQEYFWRVDATVACHGWTLEKERKY